MAAESTKVKDPYQFHTEDITEPPSRISEALRKIGPGMILAGSIVGSGELIATPTLGAEIGFVGLWVVLASCLIKPAVQAEIGRFTVATGMPALQAFNKLPGPRWKLSWMIWAWAIMVFMTLLQIGAMYGGIAQIMHQMFPKVPLNAWVPLYLALTLYILIIGGYKRIELISFLLVSMFTLLTIFCAIILVRNPQFFSLEEFLKGFSFELPPGGLASAVAVFGITGVGATEMLMYPYWCIEKGYARFTGPNDGTESWVRRARGWIRVMLVDIFCSMVVYTAATVAFFLLGAGVLHGLGIVPSARDMMQVLSRTYTETLGPWSLYLFWLGAIATFYSTIISSTGAHARLFADMFRLLGVYGDRDYAARLRYQRLFVVLLNTTAIVLYFALQSPVAMVKAGGVAQAIMLPVIALGTLYLLHRHLPKVVAPSRLNLAAVWIATALITALMTYYAVVLIKR